jgi:transketolase
LGSVTVEILAEEFPVPVEYVGVRDQFGQTGDPDELMKYYNVDRNAIIIAVRDVVRRK